MHKLSDFDIKNKNLTIRVDMNVPIREGEVIDQTRIKACIPTIELALKNNANILLISHLGRPEEGRFDDGLSLKPVAKCLSEIFQFTVDVIKDLEDVTIFNGSSPIQVLENIRFFDGEKSNKDSLGKSLADLGDIYVFDAFGTSHREQASTHSAITNSKFSCAGLLLEKEIEALTKALKNSDSPFVAVIGGAKVSTKLELIKNINIKAENIIVGGGIANTFIKAAGYEIGKSLYEESMLNVASEILESNKIMLPEKVVTSLSFEGKNIQEKMLVDINKDDMILDQFVTEAMKQTLLDSKIILWNGPLGVFENDSFSKGTEELSKIIASSDSFSLAGGGETLTAINKFINKDDVSYCSTGGGAFLEFMEGKELPSIAALKAKIL